MLCFDVYHAVGVLYDADNEQKAIARDDQAVAFKNIRSQNNADDASIGNGFRKIAKNRAHLASAAQAARSVCREQTSRAIERGMVANHSEYIENLAVVLTCRAISNSPKCAIAASRKIMSGC